MVRRVALLTDGIWPFVIGGMQRHSYYICKYLALNKITVELYHTTKDGSHPDLATCFSDEERKYINPRYITYPKADKWPGHYIRASYRYSAAIFERFLASEMPDIIYIKGLAGLKLLQEKSCGRKFPPVFLNVHGYEYYQQAPSFKALLQNFMLRPVFKKVNERSDFIFSYGGRITDIIRNRIGIADKRVVEVPSAVEPAALTKQEILASETRRFVFVGRYERRKGVEELFAALKSIPKSKKFIFHFIGSIPDEYKVRLPNMVYHGQLTNGEEIKTILENSDVLVCPSYSEGMPNVILEGMAAGCSVIASDVGAIPIVVTNDAGWLIKPGAVGPLRQAIVNVIGMSIETLTDKRRRSLARVRDHFVWEVAIQRIIHAFQNAIVEFNNRQCGQG